MTHLSDRTGNDERGKSRGRVSRFAGTLNACVGAVPQRLSRRSKVGLLGICLIALIAAHLPDLHLPYFWDEAGYFVPAALDLFATGDPIPRSVAPNPHPPLVMAILATAWRLFGFSPVITRLTMLCWAAIALLAVYELGEHLAGPRLGIAGCLCTFLYPVFFAQSALAQLDLPAAAMTLWGIDRYARGKLRTAALCLSAAVLCKETAVVAAGTLFLVEYLSMVRAGRVRNWRSLAFLALPIFALVLWLFYVQARTGSVFGNSEFAKYNINAEALAPSRLLAALLHRLWDVFGHLFLFVLTLPAALISSRSRLASRHVDLIPRAVAAMIAAYVVAFSFLGGALLARYLLTAVILVIVLSIYATIRQWRYWWTLIPVASVAFIVGLVTPPPYHYAYDENLIYRDVIEVHRQAAAHLSFERRPVITTWPASDELSKPSLGYVAATLPVVAIPDLSTESIKKAVAQCRDCPILFFPTQYEPPSSILRPGAVLRRFRFWNDAQRHFGTRPAKLTPEIVAAEIGGQVTAYWQAGPAYAAVLRVADSK